MNKNKIICSFLQFPIFCHFFYISDWHSKVYDQNLDFDIESRKNWQSSSASFSVMVCNKMSHESRATNSPRKSTTGLA